MMSLVLRSYGSELEKHLRDQIDCCQDQLAARIENLDESRLCGLPLAEFRRLLKEEKTYYRGRIKELTVALRKEIKRLEKEG